MTEMTPALATLFNSAMAAIGINWRIEEYTPERSAQAIVDTPDLLAEVDRSQMMAGDKPLAEGTTAADILANPQEALKGYLHGSRPAIPHLGRRMGENWKWYLSVMYRLINEGVMDGFSRLLASALYGQSFWTLVYVDADPEDFPYLDEAQSSRTDKDVVRNGDATIKDQLAGLEAKYLPRLWAELNDSDAENVIPEQWLPLREKYASEVEATDAFITTHKGTPRKELFAWLYLKFVLLDGCKEVEKLLECFVTGISRSVNEAQMLELRYLIKANTKSLYEGGILPALRQAFDAAESGQSFEFKPVRVRRDGKLVTTKVECVVKRRRKAAAAGRP